MHGIKRRSSSYNHPRLEHIMEEGTHRAIAICVWVGRFAPRPRSGTAGASADAHRVAARARVPAKRATRLLDIVFLAKRPSHASDTPQPALTDAPTTPRTPRGLFPAPTAPRHARFF